MSDPAWVGARFLVATSLKTYFRHAQAVDWAERVADLCREHPGVASGVIEVAVLPSFVALPAVLAAAEGSPLVVGAQDVSAGPAGAHTGEVSAAELAEVGCRLVAVGHAERRRDHGETDAVVSAKVSQALEHGLTPLICVGEPDRVAAPLAAEHCLAQARSGLADARRQGLSGSVALAYEPVWAIGAAQPAGPEHITTVCRALRAFLADAGAAQGGDVVRDGRVVYGGSAGPGLLTRISSEVDGIFLGRFAHEVSALRAVLDEAQDVAEAEGRPS